MAPTAETCGASMPSVTSAVRTPRLSCIRGLTLTWFGLLAASAYTGTSIMSMNGDLPGLSNRVAGTIGSW